MFMLSALTCDMPEHIQAIDANRPAGALGEFYLRPANAAAFEYAKQLGAKYDQEIKSLSSNR